VATQENIIGEEKDENHEQGWKEQVFLAKQKSHAHGREALPHLLPKGKKKQKEIEESLIGLQCKKRVMHFQPQLNFVSRLLEGDA